MIKLRKDKTNYYLDIAKIVSERSTCLRRHYGCVIVKNDEIIATGYNGAPRKRKNCEGKCNFNGNNIPECCPPYTPDFIKLAESYGAYAVRVMDEDKLSDTFKKAKENTDAPTIIEILIDFKDVVLPMVQGGKSLDDMLLETNY